MVTPSRLASPKLAAAIVAIFALALCGPSQAQMSKISLSIDDVVAVPGQQSVEVPVYISNNTDTLSGIELWFQLNRPDICVFDIDTVTQIDTTYWQCTNGTPPACTDSVLVTESDPWDMMHLDTMIATSGGLSIVGGLISDWEYVEFRSLTGMGVDLKVVALADNASPGSGPVGLLPGETGLLFTLVFNCLTPPGFVTDRRADILLNPLADHMSFSDPHGMSIGLVCEQVEDSTCYVCDQWLGEVCLSWSQVAIPPYDSCAVEMVNVCHIDSMQIVIDDGSVTLCGPIIAGDVDDNGSYGVDDLTLLSQFAFNGTPALANPTNGDVNGDCAINWQDINLLMVGGPYTDCGCFDPIWYCCMGMRGNVDYDVTGGGDDIDISDLTSLVGYMFKQGEAPPCQDEANVDGDVAKSIDIADLTRLANYMFKSGTPPANCDQ